MDYQTFLIKNVDLKHKLLDINSLYLKYFFKKIKNLVNESFSIVDFFPLPILKSMTFSYSINLYFLLIEKGFFIFSIHNLTIQIYLSILLNMIHENRKIERYFYTGEPTPIERLKFICSLKLQEFKEHHSGKGSRYFYIGNYKIRFSNHENTSKYHKEPDLNIVNRKLTMEEVDNIEKKIQYPEYCKQKVFGLYVGLSIQKLKKILPDYCYEKIIENEYYSNTYTTVIKVKPSLDYLDSQGYCDRNPIRQEITSFEDYSGKEC